MKMKKTKDLQDKIDALDELCCDAFETLGSYVQNYNGEVYFKLELKALAVKAFNQMKDEIVEDFERLKENAEGEEDFVQKYAESIAENASSVFGVLLEKLIIDELS